MSLEFFATTFILPFLILILVTILKYAFDALYTAGSDILGFLIALDACSILNFKHFETALSIRQVKIQFGHYLKGNCLFYFLVLTILGLIFLVLTLKTEKAIKDHYLLKTSKPFLRWIFSFITVFFTIGANLFALFSVVM
jgi:hypothetical protein